MYFGSNFYNSYFKLLHHNAARGRINGRYQRYFQYYLNILSEIKYRNMFYTFCNTSPLYNIHLSPPFPLLTQTTCLRNVGGRHF